MRYATLLSGGKDSVLAHHVAHQWGWEPAGVLLIRPGDPHSHLYHTPNLDVVRLQTEAMGLPLHEVPAAPVESQEGEALVAACAHARDTWEADTVITGAVASEYQRVRVESAGHRAGVKTHHPLWHKPPAEVLRTVRAARFDVRFSAVAAEGLGREWLGRALDDAAVSELVRLGGRGLHAAGEGGEYETLVLDAPLFGRRIEVDEAETEWKRDSGIWRVRGARLGTKA